MNISYTILSSTIFNCPVLNLRDAKWYAAAAALQNLNPKYFGVKYETDQD